MHTWLITSTPWLRALLGFIFLLAAVSKLRDARGFAAALGALGIERPAFRESLKIGVPLAEAGLGLWLWTGWSPLFSAVTASVVLVLLALVLVHLRRTGYTGTCGCFIGDNGAVGALQIVRNSILFVLSLWVGLGAFVIPDPFRPTSPSWERLPLLAVMATMVMLGAYVLMTRKARVPRGLEIFAEPAAPPTEVTLRMELTDLAGERVVLGRPKGDAQLVVFAKGRCPGCLRDRDLLNRLPAQPLAFETVIVCGGDLEETKEFASEVRLPVRVVADPRWRTAAAWQVTTTPFSVLVDNHGHVRARGKLTSALSLLAPQVEGSPIRHHAFRHDGI
jgi:peroxiredoxin